MVFSEIACFVFYDLATVYRCGLFISPTPCGLLRLITPTQAGSTQNAVPGGGYCHILAIWVCAAVKGMVFKQFTLG